MFEGILIAVLFSLVGGGVAYRAAKREPIIRPYVQEVISLMETDPTAWTYKREEKVSYNLTYRPYWWYKKKALDLRISLDCDSGKPTRIYEPIIFELSRAEKKFLQKKLDELVCAQLNAATLDHLLTE